MRVIIESPFKGGHHNVVYARQCLRDSLLRGESPYASHLLYPQVLDDNIPAERRYGIDAADRWLEVADLTAAYCNLGISDGMVMGFVKAYRLRKRIVLRWLDPAREVVIYEGN